MGVGSPANMPFKCNDGYINVSDEQISSPLGIGL